MRACSASTAALLASPPPGLRSADLFTFTLRDGVTTYRWTSFDRDLTVNGNLYSSRKPWLERSQWSIANTMQVPTLEVFLRALSDGFSGGIDIKGQMTNGLFDGATATLDRVWFVSGTTVNDRVGGYRYFKLNITASSGFGVFDLIEWQMAETPAGPNLIQGKTVTASTGSGGQPVACIVDGSTATGPFESTGLPAWVKVDVGAGNEFGPAEFRLCVNSIAHPQDFSLLGSNDDVTYTTIGSWSGFTGYSGLFTTFAVSSPSRSHPGVRLFGGNVANIDITGNEATINIKGRVNLLDQNAPRNLYQLGCEHAFCDAGCTLARASYTSSHTVGASPTRSFIPWTGTPPANAANFRYGTVTFVSGPCIGQSRTVRAADSSGVTLVYPLVGTPAAGDSFTTFEGCDKALSSGSGQDCTARGNTQNWRAFPYVPPADSAF